MSSGDPSAKTKHKYNPSNFKSTFTEGKQFDKLIPSKLLMNAEKWKY